MKAVSFFKFPNSHSGREKHNLSNIYLVPRPLCVIRNMFKFLRWVFFSTSPNTLAGGPPLVGYPLLLDQYIRIYPPSATWENFIPWWQGPTYSVIFERHYTEVGWICNFSFNPQYFNACPTPAQTNTVRCLFWQYLRRNKECNNKGPWNCDWQGDRPLWR